MIREEKIEFIYKKIANKDLNFGCLFKYKDKDFAEFRICCIKEGWWIINWIEWGGLKAAFRENFINNTIIIWHKVMIGDVIDFIKKNNIRYSSSDIDNYFWISKSSQYIFEQLWKNLTAPIEYQSNECIDFVYSLLEKKDKTFTQT